MSNNPDVGKVFNLTGGNGGDGSLKLEGLSITKAPLKTTYKSGQSFDPTGMVVTALYAYGLTSDATGYTVSPNVLTDGVSKVTITYTEGRITKTASVNVTVEKVLSSIKVTTPPTKTTYNYLEKFQPNGMVVTATFSDGSTTAATGYGYPTTAFSTLGQQSVSLSYTYEGVTKSTTLNVTVQAIKVAVPVQKNIPTYDGTQKTPVWNGYDSVKMTMDGDTSGVNAKNNYSVTFTLIYGYVFPDGTNSATVMWRINRAVIEAAPTQIDIPAADGGPKSPSWNGYDPVKMTIGGDRTGSAAGEYTASFTPTANYQWWDGKTVAKNATWVIASILVTIPTQKNIPTYDGSEKTPEWNSFDTENSTVQVTAMTNAGEYEATFSLLRGMWSDSSTDPKTVKWKINRASIAAVPKQINVPTYDGNPKTPSWDSNYSAVKMTMNFETAVNAGTDYPVSFTPTSNYQWWDGKTGVKSTTWTVNKATPVVTAPTARSLKFNSSNQALVNSGRTTGGSLQYSTDGNTYSTDIPTGYNAGRYTVYYKVVGNKNYESVAAQIINVTIAQKAGTLTLKPTSITLNASAKTGTFEIQGEFDGNYTVESLDTKIATVELVSGKTYRVSSVNDTTGTTSVKVTCYGGKNYTVPATKTVSVTAQFVNIYGVEWDWTSSGPTKGVRTDAAAGFSDPNPAVNNGTGSSPFDNLYPWSGMVKETRTGGVMVKEPKYWFKWTKTGKKLKLQIADGPVDGFSVDPVNMDRGDGLGEVDFSYIGRYHCSENNWKSTTGVAQKTGCDIYEARSRIHNLAPNIWQFDFAQFWYTGMLYLVEFADWNGQAAIGYGCSANGSKENNGATDAMQYHTGTTAANRTTYGFTQYRSIEGYWDSVYDLVDGCANTGGLSIVTNPAKYGDDTAYVSVGYPKNGYPSDFAIPTQEGLEWALYPCAASGSETTYTSDEWRYNGKSGTIIHGGYYSQYQKHGPFHIDCEYGSMGADNVGCRLWERPVKENQHIVDIDPKGFSANVKYPGGTLTTTERISFVVEDGATVTVDSSSSGMWIFTKNGTPDNADDPFTITINTDTDIDFVEE